ncbi:MAG: hypothetical protein FH753_09050 [Firmicutes bacterium]|nr:hypothetical protein [Bacillota bacterium]
MKKIKSINSKILCSMIFTTTLCMIFFMVFSYFQIQKTVTKQMRNDGITLIKTLRQEIVKYNIKDLNEIQGIFKKIDD